MTPNTSHGVETMSKREEAMLPLARAIAQGLGDTFEHAFTSKSEWNEARGEKGGRYRDINEPMQSDYMDAAAEAFDVMIQVLMEPDEAMMEAAAPWPTHWPKDGPDFPMMRAAVLTDQMSAAGNFRTMLKVASA